MRGMADTADLIRRRFDALDPVLDEQARRRFAAAEARVLGRGGVTLVSKVTGIARSTINRGITEIEENRSAGQGRVRRPGGGRRAKTQEDPTLLDDLQSLLEASTRGDPMSPLLWTSKSLDKLCAALKGMRHDVCPNVVAKLLRKLGYSLQSNRKTREGSKHPDRDAQFHYLDARMKEHMLEQSPVISVDTKKKELVGDFKNAGQELRPKASPEEVRVHDFIDRDLGRAVPYGIYDIADNKGWVSVGVDHDTAAFAVNTIRRWWSTMGQERYPNAKRLMITADGGGSNGARVRLWKACPRAGGDRAAEVRRRDRHSRHGLPSPARHEQMEQDRAPPVRVHHQELARQTTRQSPDNRPTDRRDDDREGPCSTR